MQILVVQTAFIGDVVLTTPLLESLCVAYPNAKIHFVGVKSGCEILKNNPRLECHVLDKKRGIKAIQALVMKLSNIQFDFVFCVHRSPRSLWIAKSVRSKRKFAFRSLLSKIMRFETIPYPKYSDNTHYRDKPLELLKLVPVSRVQKPVLYLEKDQSILEKIKSENFLVLSPFSVWGTKMWFSDRYAIAAAAIAKEFDLTVVITGSEGREKIIADNMVERIKQSGAAAINLVGQTTLPELTGLISKSKLVLSNDSASVHIASAFDIPTVAVFGPTVKRFGFFPLSTKSEVVEKSVECRPCSLHGPRRCPKGHFRCMNEIQIEDVVNAATKVLNG